MNRRELVAEGLRYLAQVLPAMVVHRRKPGSVSPPTHRCRHRPTRRLLPRSD